MVVFIATVLGGGAEITLRLVSRRRPNRCFQSLRERRFDILYDTVIGEQTFEYVAVLCSSGRTKKKERKVH